MKYTKLNLRTVLTCIVTAALILTFSNLSSPNQYGRKSLKENKINSQKASQNMPSHVIPRVISYHDQDMDLSETRKLIEQGGEGNTENSVRNSLENAFYQAYSESAITTQKFNQLYNYALRDAKIKPGETKPTPESIVDSIEVILNNISPKRYSP